MAERVELDESQLATQFVIQVERLGEKPDISAIRALLEGTGC